MMSRKAQESGTLQNLLMALIIITGVAYFSLGYLQGLSDNYGVTLNESQYTVFAQLDEINETLGTLTNQFYPTDEDGGQQNEDSDIITVMLTSAYGLIKIVFGLPELFFSLINSAIVAIGVPVGFANVLTWMATSVVLVLILFAVVALVMKVRA